MKTLEEIKRMLIDENEIVDFDNDILGPEKVIFDNEIACNKCGKHLAILTIRSSKEDLESVINGIDLKHDKCKPCKKEETEKTKTCAIPRLIYVYPSDVAELVKSHLMGTRISVNAQDGQRYNGYLTEVHGPNGYEHRLEFTIEEFPTEDKLKQNDSN